MTLSHKPNSSVLLAASMIFAVVDSPLLAQSNADSGAAVTSVQGRVRMPDKAPEGINVDGLSLDDVVITLEGRYNHPRMPYPPNWSSMAREERSEWSQAFRNSEEYEDYTRKVEEARAKRDVFTTEIAADGSFVFNGIKPTWYQLTAMIMHPKATGKPTFEHSRAHAMRQFIIKSADEPYHAP